MIDINALPIVNATLNGISALFLLVGYGFVRRGRIIQHRICMVTAFTTSTLFLASYLIYHFNVGSVPFTGEGAIRLVYFTILISHVILAALILPLALMTLRHALKKDFNRHASIARWTLPLWIYVSVTGVIIYWMLYVM